MSEFCQNCGVLCCGDHRVQISKNCEYIFCNYCWVVLEEIDVKELKRIIRNGGTIIT